MRNLELEREMLAICSEIWPRIGKSKFYDGLKKMPSVESKQGGSSGCYYPSQHKVYFRWNVWNKMPLAGKRLLAIHELWHATGRNHNGATGFCHAHDILSLELYKRIYGEDAALIEVTAQIKEAIDAD